MREPVPFTARPDDQPRTGRGGFAADAADVACRFMNLAVAEFVRTGLLFEKYDAAARTADVSGKIHFGYPPMKPASAGPTGYWQSMHSTWP